MNDQVHPVYTIGFFTTGVELEYSTILFQAVSKIAKEYQVNLVNFLGGSLNPDFSFQQYKHQYQCNVAFDYANQEVLDGIILASGVLSSFLSPTEYRRFYSKFKNIPTVSLGSFVNDMPSVYTDNKAVLKQLVSHLITKHHKKNIAFLSGPSSNCDALDRYLGYKEALRENNIPFREDYIRIGDFTPDSAIEAVKVLFDQGNLPIDAVVCSNDSMALTVLNELQKRDIKVPEDVAITGFDNIHTSAYCVPSLSTIEQPLEDFARNAFQLLINMLQGHPVQNRLIPCKLILRESCGCNFFSAPMLGPILNIEGAKLLAESLLTQSHYYLPNSTIPKLEEFVIQIYSLLFLSPAQFPTPATCTNLFLKCKKALSPSLATTLNLKHFLASLKKDWLLRCDDLSKIGFITNLFENLSDDLFNDSLKYYGHKTNRVTNNFAFIRQVLLSITHNITVQNLTLSSIAENLMTCGIHTCLVYLYDEGITHHLTDKWQMPEKLHLYMGYIDDKIIDNIHEVPPLTPKEIVTYGLTNKDHPYTSFIHSIFFGNEQLGVIVLEMPSDNYDLIETLTLELGCALKLSSIFRIEKTTKNKLETLSQTDELTGLLNRRGFFTKAVASYNLAKQQNRKGILFYADMDGLKVINDTCGHSEGDVAIVAMSKIFKQIFKNPDTLIARMGGDEFIIFCLDKEESYIEYVTTQIEVICKNFNITYHKSYKFSISIGGVPFNANSSPSLEELLKAANKKLYGLKKLKKELATSSE
ncbi:GGDEF domain-containing protein [Cellulosilyticum ruminicola]|uniref:GGDEF domain-containing protein n=1 Tax=Cellulosilyticum ruminicola TaxID=425254 RepID=UPI0006D0ED9D|nr:GGDEF domain-containing protein [Cellulosilyticum ruminicola]